MYSKEHFDHLFYRMKNSIPTSSKLFLVISIIKLYPLFFLTHAAGYTVPKNDLSTIHTYMKFFSLTFYLHSSFKPGQIKLIVILIFLVNILLILWLIYYLSKAKQVKKLDENYGNVASLGVEFRIFSNFTFFKYIILFQFFQEINFLPLECIKGVIDYEKITVNDIFSSNSISSDINEMCSGSNLNIFIIMSALNFICDILFYWFITSRFFDFNILSDYKWNFYPSLFFSFEFIESLMQICFIFFLSFSNNTYKIIVDIFVLIIFLVHIYKTFNNTSFYTADTSVYVRISEFIRIMCYISSLLIAIFQFGIDSLPNDVDLLGFIIFESILAYLLVSVSHRNDNLYIKNILVTPVNQIRENNVYGTLIFLIKEFKFFSDVNYKFNDHTLDLFLENYVNHLKICEDYNCPCKNYVKKINANNTLKSGYTTMINLTHMKKEQEEDEYILNKFFNVLSANISPILKYSNNINLNEVSNARQVLIFQLRGKLIMAVKKLLSYRLERLTREMDGLLSTQFKKETKDFIRINFYAVNIMCNKAYYKTQFLFHEYLSDYFKRRERNYTFNLIWYSYLKKFAIKEYSKSNATKQIKKEHSNSVMHIDSRVVLSLCVKYYEIEERLLRTIENYRTLIAYFRANNLIFDTLLGFIKKFKHEYKNITNYISHFFKNDKINNLFVCTKIILFFKVIHFDIPESLHNRLIIQVHDNEDKDKSHSYIDSNYYMIINYINGEFVIKFISHELLIVLEYSEEEVRDKDFHMLLPQSLRRMHKNVLINEIKTRGITSNNKEIFLVSKSQTSSLYDIQYKFLLNLSGEITILTIVNLRKNQKDSKLCFACIDDHGELLAVNREFEDYFGITMRMLEYVKIDIEKVVLQGMGDRMRKFFKNEENIEFAENYDYDQYITSLFEEDLDAFKEKNEKEFKKIQSRWEILKELNRKRRISTKFLELNIKQRALGKENIYFLKFEMKNNDTLRSLEPHSTTLSLIHAVKISKREMAKLSFYKGEDMFERSMEAEANEEKNEGPQDDLFESQSQISSAITELKERNSVRLFRQKRNSLNFLPKSRNIVILMVSIGVLAIISIVYNILSIVIKVDMYNTTQRYLHLGMNTLFLKKNIFFLSTTISLLSLIEEGILDYSITNNLPINLHEDLIKTIENESGVVNDIIYNISFISSQFYKQEIDQLLNKEEKLNYIFDNGYIYHKTNSTLYQGIVDIKKEGMDILNKYEEGNAEILNYIDSPIYQYFFCKKIFDIQDSLSSLNIVISSQNMELFFLIQNLFNKIDIFIEELIITSLILFENNQSFTITAIINIKVVEFVLVIIVIAIEWVFLYIGYEKSKKKIVRVVQKVERNNVRATLKKIDEFIQFSNNFNISSLYFIADLDLKKVDESSKTFEGSTVMSKSSHSLYSSGVQSKKKIPSSFMFSSGNFGFGRGNTLSGKKDLNTSFKSDGLIDEDKIQSEPEGKKNLLKVMHKLDQIKGFKKQKENQSKQNEDNNNYNNEAVKTSNNSSEASSMYEGDIGGNNNNSVDNFQNKLNPIMNEEPVKPALRAKDKKQAVKFDDEAIITNEEESKVQIIKNDEGFDIPKKPGRTTRVQFKEKNVRYYSPGQNVNEVVDFSKSAKEKRDSLAGEKINLQESSIQTKNVFSKYSEQTTKSDINKSSSNTFLTNHGNDNERSLLHVINLHNNNNSTHSSFFDKKVTEQKHKNSSTRDLPNSIQWSNLQDNSNSYAKYQLIDQGRAVVVKKAVEKEKDIPKKEVIESKIDNVVYNNTISKIILNSALTIFTVLYIINIALNFLYRNNLNQAALYSYLLFNKTSLINMIMLKYEFSLIQNEHDDSIEELIKEAEHNKEAINSFEVNKNPKLLHKVYQLEKVLEGNDSCKKLSNLVVSYYNSSYEDELKECETVGDFMNSNGISKAESYVLSTLIVLIEDWKKIVFTQINETIIMQKLNDLSFVNIICEIEYTFKKYSNLLRTFMRKDVDDIFSTIKRNEKILGCFSIGMNIIFIVLSLVFIIYPIKAVELIISWLSHKIIIS